MSDERKTELAEAEKWLRAGGFSPPKMAQIIAVELDRLRTELDQARERIEEIGTAVCAIDLLLAQKNVHSKEEPSVGDAVLASTVRTAIDLCALAASPAAIEEMQKNLAAAQENVDRARKARKVSPSQLTEPYSAASPAPVATPDLQAQLAQANARITELVGLLRGAVEGASPAPAPAPVAEPPLVESAEVIRENSRVVAIATGNVPGYVAYVYCRNAAQANAIRARLMGGGG